MNYRFHLWFHRNDIVTRGADGCADAWIFLAFIPTTGMVFSGYGLYGEFNEIGYSAKDKTHWASINLKEACVQDDSDDVTPMDVVQFREAVQRLDERLANPHTTP